MLTMPRACNAAESAFKSSEVPKFEFKEYMSEAQYLIHVSRSHPECYHDAHPWYGLPYGEFGMFLTMGDIHTAVKPMPLM